MDKKTIVVNLFGGPGTGKSTAAARIFSDLKMAGVNCELVTEYAKDLTWQQSYSVLANQIYILGKQFQRINRVVGQVDVVITDSPLLLSMIYNNRWKCLDPLVLEAFNSTCNVNYFLTREKEYNPIGRNQSEAEAIGLDEKIKSMLDKNKINYANKRASIGGILSIVKEVLDVMDVIERHS